MINVNLLISYRILFSFKNLRFYPNAGPYLSLNVKHRPAFYSKFQCISWPQAIKKKETKEKKVQNRQRRKLQIEQVFNSLFIWLIYYK